MSAYPEGDSRVIPGRYPPPGTSPIADAIRARRGPARGLTKLDSALLHCPPVAGGFNSLLGAVRGQGKVEGGLREIMILRVAALNGAKYEWIHHEHVARSCGVNTAQLYSVRDVETPLPPRTSSTAAQFEGVLTPLHIAALEFTDASTRGIKVPMGVVDGLKAELEVWVKKRREAEKEERGGEAEKSVQDEVDDLFVECAMIVSSYNMVSRFLMAMDVAGMSDDEVPWPLGIDRREHRVTVKSGHILYALTLTTSPTGKWLMFSNSLLTSVSMWFPLIPYILALPNGPYNLLFFDQRLHGKSTLSAPSIEDTTIQGLASDIFDLVNYFSSEKLMTSPIHALIGVSQGGAAALAYLASFDDKRHVSKYIICDTAPRTPKGNQEAWAERVRLVLGRDANQPGSPDASASVTASFTGITEQEEFFARSTGGGLSRLAEPTLGRWFPLGSSCSASSMTADSSTTFGPSYRQWVGNMIERTPVRGFVEGARALGDYEIEENKLFEASAHSKVGVLLLAGSLDGGGKVGQGLEALRSRWSGGLLVDRRDKVIYVEVKGAGHLPMIDETARFASALGEFLSER